MLYIGIILGVIVLLLLVALIRTLLTPNKVSAYVANEPPADKDERVALEEECRRLRAENAALKTELERQKRRQRARSSKSASASSAKPKRKAKGNEQKQELDELLSIQ